MTTPEQLRMIANRLLGIANRLEAAPQPPVEQSEPKSGVWVDSGHGLEFREIIVGGFQCPMCRVHDETKCKWTPFAWPKRADKHLWLAPAAVIEPEPELEEPTITELTDKIQDALRCAHELIERGKRK